MAACRGRLGACRNSAQSFPAPYPMSAPRTVLIASEDMRL
jgi:hypothetical protein